MSSSASRAPAPGDPGGPGRLEADGQKATLTFRRQLAHPIREVWEAITEPRQVEAWFMVKLRRDPGVGGRLEMEHPNEVRATGRVLVWDPPRIYEYEWNLPPGPNQPEGEASIVRWELTPHQGGTQLVMTHRQLSRSTANVFSRGFGVLLDRLASHLDGAPMPQPPWVASPSRGARQR